MSKLNFLNMAVKFGDGEEFIQKIFSKTVVSWCCVGYVTTCVKALKEMQKMDDDEVLRGGLIKTLIKYFGTMPIQMLYQPARTIDDVIKLFKDKEFVDKFKETFKEDDEVIITEATEKKEEE